MRRSSIVILCGGESLRFKNSSHDVSKALAPIGNRPILVHIIDRFRFFGMDKFIICTRDSDKDISDFFATNLEYARGVTVVPTGENVPTGGRIKAIEHLIDESDFLVSYGDFLTDIDLNTFWAYHLKCAKVGTLMAVNPNSAYGVLGLDQAGTVSKFEEKPRLLHWVNGGLFAFNRKLFDYLDDGTTLETDGFGKLIEDGELAACKHHGFWQAMDTPKEHRLLIEIWESGNAPWSD